MKPRPRSCSRRGRRLVPGALEERGVRIETLASRDGCIDLASLLGRLGALECNEILVEAGPALAVCSWRRVWSTSSCSTSRPASSAMLLDRCSACHRSSGWRIDTTSACATRHASATICVSCFGRGERMTMFTGIVMAVGRLRAAEELGGPHAARNRYGPVIACRRRRRRQHRGQRRMPNGDATRGCSFCGRRLSRNARVDDARRSARRDAAQSRHSRCAPEIRSAVTT